jgi:hypothetical protein
MSPHFRRVTSNTPQILHVGTGYINALIVLFPQSNETPWPAPEFHQGQMFLALAAMTMFVLTLKAIVRKRFQLKHINNRFSLI